MFCSRINTRWNGRIISTFILLNIISRINGQLPDDIQRELNQNLAEQARIQAMRQQHQDQIKSRQQAQPQPQAQSHDPNNYSYQQVSPPIQYSYYQPFGDAAQQQPTGGNQQQQQQRQQASADPRSSSQANNFDFNNLNFDLPQPQAQVSSNQPVNQQPALTPSFVGVGGLPVMKPIAGSAAPPLAPQARVQQGPPLSEADFRDITGGENYGAPGGQDFGLGASSSGGGGNGNSARRQDNTDAQLREFGFPGDESGMSQSNQQPAAQMNVPDFGGFGPIGASGSGQRQTNTPTMDDNFGGFDAMSGPSSTSSTSSRPSGNDFDFGVQPSQSESRGDQMNPMGQTSAPGSLQSLLGAGFPGLGSGGGGGGAGPASGLDDGFPAGLNDPAGQQTQRSSPGSAAGSSPMDIADMGDKSDQFSGADLGGFGGSGEQPSQNPAPRNEQDFNFASSNEQPSSVPYPDSGPQPVGSLLAITQPQSLTQTRYSVLPDKGSYQDYPAYAQSDSSDSSFGFGSSVNEVIERTPAPRQSIAGRYGRPSFGQLAPEYRHLAARHYDYSRGPQEW